MTFSANFCTALGRRQHGDVAAPVAHAAAAAKPHVHDVGHHFLLRANHGGARRGVDIGVILPEHAVDRHALGAVEDGFVPHPDAGVRVLYRLPTRSGAP